MHTFVLRLQTASELAILGLVAFLILWHGGKTLDGTWLLAIAGCVPVMFFWWRQHRLQAGDPPVASPPRGLWWALMFFLVWTVISYLLSTTKNYGLDEVLRDGSCVLVFFWIYRLSSCPPLKTSLMRRIVHVAVIAGLIACLFGIAVYVLQPVNRFVGTFVDPRFVTDYWPNAWAQFLLLLWPLAYAVTLKKKLPVSVAVLGLITGCLFLSYSRGAFLVFVAQLGLMALLLLVGHLRRSRVPQAVRVSLPLEVLRAGLILLVALAVFFGVNQLRGQFHPVQSVAEKATFTASEGTSSVDERRHFWEASYALAMERPFFGWGPYSFRFIQPRLQTDVFVTSDHAHNVFLKLAMERGWPAAFLFALILVWVLLGATRESLRTPASPGGRTWDADLVLPAVIGVLGVTAHNLIDYNLQFVAIALLFWLLLGFLASRLRSAGKASPSRVLRTVEVLLAMIILCVAVLEGRNLIFSSLGRRAEAQGRIQEALEWYDEARNQMFSRDMHLSRASLYMAQRQWPEARDALLDYEKQNAEDARLWMLRGGVAEAVRDLQGAIQFYDKASILGRYNYLGILTGSLTTLRDLRDRSLLKDHEPQYRNTVQAYAAAVMRNAHYIGLSQNVEEFEKVAALMAQLYRADADLYRSMSIQVKAKALRLREELGNSEPGVLW